MPLIVQGENYRVFAEPTIFSCNSQSQIQQIEIPVDNAFAFVADALGATDFELWRFNAASAAVASSTVIIPDNPLFAALGRWYKIPTGGSGPGGGGLQNGSGSPEGVADAENGQFYIDTDLIDGFQRLYANLATSGTTGWFQLLEF